MGRYDPHQSLLFPPMVFFPVVDHHWVGRHTFFYLLVVFYPPLIGRSGRFSIILSSFSLPPTRDTLQEVIYTFTCTAWKGYLVLSCPLGCFMSFSSPQGVLSFLGSKDPPSLARLTILPWTVLFFGIRIVPANCLS